MTTSEIESLVSKFAAAARRAADVGFEIIEIHAAHGYLLHQFLSPVTNTRTDRYGGDFESRTRFLKEVTMAINSEWPDDRPISVRISATDWLPDRDSWTVEDSVQLSSELIDLGVDLIDVSGVDFIQNSRYPKPAPDIRSLTRGQSARM
jgi:2,4-dienoyl-CoA reductase-like NADH-dependent reductase (Old Yellow Enzyme family)